MQTLIRFAAATGAMYSLHSEEYWILFIAILVWEVTGGFKAAIATWVSGLGN